MAWISLTEAKLLTAISGTELERFRSAALGDDQVDPVEDVLSQVTREVRGYVAGCPSNQLGEGATIPDELERAALDKAVMRIMSRAAGVVLDPKGTRKEAAEAADKLLVLVASCKFAIEQPDTVSEEVTAGGSISVVSDTTRRATRTKLNGLL